MNIGSTIRTLRKSKFPKLTQSKFAKSVGTTQTYLSQIECGNKNPSFGILESISKELDVPLPILSWLSIEESDVKKEKLEIFRLLKPTIDNMIYELINETK
jgi:transcriptional regulator with XRE-family HTH domain